MNKKGFTLAELMGVIVILLAVFMIAIPTIDRTLKQGRQKLFDEQVETIKASLQEWTSIYQKPREGEAIKLTLSQLKEAGLADYDITNPKTEKLFPNDMVLTIYNNDGILEYSVDTESGSNITNYEQLPVITLIGDALVYSELGGDYQDLGTNEGVLGVIDNNFSNDTVGNYFITYTKVENGNSNTIYRSVVVRDTTPPVINFSDLTISSSKVYDYDFTTGVTVEDSSETLELEIDKSALSSKVGVYSIRYTIYDIYGNKTIKYRKITVN